MKILVAVDFSPHAREAIRFVRSVDWPKKSEIYLIHVIELKNAPSLISSDGPFGWDRVISQAREEMETKARLFLEQTKRKFLKRCPHIIRSIVVEGLPGAEILQAVKDYQIDLVLLGTRGLSNVKRFLLGSTSEWVMGEASCSVLLVRKKLSKVTMGKTAAKILLATDGSSGTSHMVRMLNLWNFKTPPKVTVTHVVGRPAYLEGWYWGKGKAEFKQLAEQLLEKAHQDGANHLEDSRKMFKELNLNVDTILSKGNPSDEILKTAARVKPKLIIIGAKGCVNTQPIPLGGVARKISRYASCSVLVVRPGNSKEKG